MSSSFATLWVAVEINYTLTYKYVNVFVYVFVKFFQRNDERRCEMGDLGESIKRRRDEVGISQVELASKSGVSQQAISLLETGECESTTKMVVIAKALGLTAEELESGAWDNPSDETTLLTDYRALPEDKKKLVLEVVKALAR